MGNLTIYVSTADVKLLNAIFNGVAMICGQTAFIWGFALLAATWRIVSTATVATIETASGKADAVLARGSYSAVMPLVFAMLLNFPAFQSTVQVESTLNGTVTVIDNVPFVIAAIPAAGSLMSTKTGEKVSTAFQSVGTNYPALSAQVNGFANPLKVLLSSRTAIMKLSSIDTEIKQLVTACVGSDSGAIYSSIHSQVLNAGNTGATVATSIPINGVNPTAVGALLYQASRNADGQVLNLSPTSPTILSCEDAANQVATDVGNYLVSPEFARVVQGAVNGMDQPLVGADYSVNNVMTQYTALRTANTAANTLAGGAAQAAAESMNLMFAELVQSNLNCLQADGPDKANCQGQMSQAMEVERQNIERAANEVPMLKYAGSFGNYILALIIGLGPVIIMFMMLAGVDSGKCLKTAVHIMVWPLLVMNVGAEIVNGMICMNIANFMASIAQGGYISQATAIAIYKELSLQIGTGSHIMASLPVIMSMIFALGEAHALTATMSPKVGSETSKAAAPAAVETGPMVRSSPMFTAEQGPGGAAVVKGTGALSAFAGSQTMGSLITEASKARSASISRQNTVSSAQTDMANWTEAFRTQNYERFGLSREEGNSIADSYRNHLSASRKSSSGDHISASKSNTKLATAGARAGVGVEAGVGAGGGQAGPSASVGASAGVNVEGSASASDTLNREKTFARDESLDRSNALEKALTENRSKLASDSKGGEKAKSLDRSIGLQQSYQNIKSDTKTATESTSESLKATDNFVAGFQKIGSSEIAMQRSNPDFARYDAVQGARMMRNANFGKYMQHAERDMKEGITEMSPTDAAAAKTIQRFRAATLMATDPNASPEDKLAARDFLLGGAAAMNHLKLAREFDTQMLDPKIDGPKRPAGLVNNGLRSRVEEGLAKKLPTATSFSDKKFADEAALLRKENTGLDWGDTAGGFERAEAVTQRYGLTQDDPKPTPSRVVDIVADALNPFSSAAASDASPTQLGTTDPLTRPPAEAAAPPELAEGSPERRVPRPLSAAPSPAPGKPGGAAGTVELPEGSPARSGGAEVASPATQPGNPAS